MSDSKTTFSNKVSILSDLWMTCRNDEEFEDFMDYNDIALPLSYAIENKIVESTPLAENFINETWDLLLAGLEIEDTGFDNLNDVLIAGEHTE